MTRVRASLILLFMAAVWGASFAIVRVVLEFVPPITCVAIRFVIGGGVLAVIFWRQLRRITWGEIRAGLVLGFWVTVSFLFSTIALQETASGKVSFIMGLFVILVPLCSAAMLHKFPARAALVGGVISIVGLGILSLKSDFSVSTGDSWALGGALGITFHIISIAYYGNRFPPLRMAIVQVISVAIYTAPLALTIENPALVLPRQTWALMLFLSLIPTALFCCLQVYLQQFITPTTTALILNIEPIFATLTGWWLLGEVLTQKELLGCAFIFLGVVFAELRNKTKTGE